MYTVYDFNLIENIFNSLTSRDNYVVCFIKESHYLDIIIIDKLQNSLLVHEQELMVTLCKMSKY